VKRLADEIYAKLKEVMVQFGVKEAEASGGSNWELIQYKHFSGAEATLSLDVNPKVVLIDLRFWIPR